MIDDCIELRLTIPKYWS